MSNHNITGSEAFDRRHYAPGFGSITLTRAPQGARLLKRLGLLVLTMAGCAAAVGLRAQGIS